MTTTHGEWHTLTVEQEDDGPDYSLTHPDDCPLDQVAFYDCWLDGLIGEFHDVPDLIGLPTTPGVYRVRARAFSGKWAGPSCIEPKEDIELDEQSQAAADQHASIPATEGI